MISMTKLERLDRWTEVGGQRVSCVQQCVQLQASLWKKSKNNKFRHEKKKNPLAFFCRCFELQDRSSGITVELRRI